MSEDMANLWQQAEVNSGALAEVEKMASALRDRLITAPADRASPSTPSRAGLLGVLDSQANDIREVKSVLTALLDYVGERGAAPVPTTGNAINAISGYASSETKRGW